MKEWKLDPRTKKDLLDQIRKTAASYTPEWNFNPEDPDIGTALAFVYADMLEGTIRQFNRSGYKNQLSFFNCLGAGLNRAVPAGGYAAFQLPEEAVEGTEIDAFAKVTAELSEEDGGSAQFETKEDLYATPARPSCLYLTHGKSDGIYRISQNLQTEETPLVLFQEKGESLQEHVLYLAHDDVFRIQGEAYLEIGFYVRPGRLAEEAMIKTFAEKETTCFSYWSENGWQEFFEVSVMGGRLLLYKKEEQPPFATTEIGGEEHFWIRCQVFDIKQMKYLSVEDILLRSRGEQISSQSIYAASAECKKEDFFPFGEQMRLYEEVYFGSMEALTKRGAQISLSFHLDFAKVPLEYGQESDPIEWKWIMKQSDFRPDPEFDVTIEEVIWEYFNGNGWSRLFPDRRYSDLFGTQRGVLSQQKTLTFTCPADIEPILVNACETYYIRARILKMNNLYKLKGSYISPVIGAVTFSYTYGEVQRRPACIFTKNQLELFGISGCELSENGKSLSPFTGLQEEEKVLYLGFARPPVGAPVRMLWLMEETLLGERGSISWEYYGQKGWKEMNLADETRNLSRSGLVTFAGPKDFQKISCFGEELYFIRLRDENDFYSDRLPDKEYPVLRSIWMNAVEIRHMEREETEYFTLDFYEEDCNFSLMHGNICEISVYVLEGTEEEEHWVLWREVEDLDACKGTDRVYQTDRIQGAVRFGNGMHGQVPPFGKGEGIRIIYKCGGGSRANVGPGQVSRMNQTLGFVTGVTNPERLSGGLDVEEPKEALRRCSARLRHQGRAVTARDYEELAMEASRAIRKVRCFGGRNDRGEKETGAVTLVVFPENYTADKSLFYTIQEEISRYLEPRMDPKILARKQFYITEPKLARIQVRAEVMVSGFQEVFQVRRRIKERITVFLDPTEGHFDGGGWEIGQFPQILQIQNALKDIPEIVRIQKVYLTAFVNGSKGLCEVEPDFIRTHPYVLPVGGSHEVIVTVHGNG